MFLLRQFRPNDLGEVMALVSESLGEYYQPSMYLSLHSFWPEGMILAVKDRTPVGVIVGIVSAPKEARIIILAVKNEMRLQGIGTALLSKLLKQCSLRGLTSVSLEVRVSNVSAINFYRRFGFEIVNHLPRFYKDGEDGYQMWRSF